MDSLHVFKCLGIYILLDINNGSVHQVDELVYEIIPKFKKITNEQIILELQNRFLIDDIVEAITEIEELEHSNELFSQPNLSFIRNEVAVSKPAIKAMCLHIAHDCNLRCEYCFASTGNFQSTRMLMDEKIGMRAIDFLIAHSGNRTNLEIDFFGGEPLMNFNVIKSIVAYGRSLEKLNNKIFKFTLTTNGLLLNDEINRFLNEEIANVVISIDGRAEIHDRLRKTITQKGSFDMIYPKAIALVNVRKQKNYYIRGTFTRYNLDFSNDVIELAKLGFEQISLEPVIANIEEPYSIRTEDLDTIFNEYEKLAWLYIKERKEGTWFSFFHFMIDLKNGPCIIKRLTGCGSGNEYVAVTPEGDIYPCHQFVGKDEFLMGNVANENVSEVIQKSFKSNHVLNKTICMDCWAKFYCSGGCPANAYNFNHDISLPYKIGCELEKKRLECAIAIYIIEKT